MDDISQKSGWFSRMRARLIAVPRRVWLSLLAASLAAHILAVGLVLVLLFGGDRSIYQLTGDPMAGGQLDLVTDETGMAFGKPWTKDPQGTLWFLGSRGSLYAMAPGSRPQRVSRDRIERRLHDIDFGANYVRLVYNYIDEGVHILVFPFNAGGTLLEHFFYCTKTNSFHPDRFGTATDTSVQPTAALLIDGDAANDRTLLLGCEDGRIRK